MGKDLSFIYGNYMAYNIYHVSQKLSHFVAFWADDAINQQVKTLSL